MKYILCILVGLTNISCKSQTRTDILALKFNENILGLTQIDKQLKPDQDPNFRLKSYDTDKPGNYSIGNVKLSTYSYPNGFPVDYNTLSLFVTGKDKAEYLGFNYSTVNQIETKAIVSYLKKTYPHYEQRDARGNGESFFWDIQKLNAWIFMYQSISLDKSKKRFFSTNFIFVKKGTRMENSTDAKVITIKEYYNMMY